MSTSTIMLKILKMPHAAGEPVYATEGSAGMDLLAAVDDSVMIPPMGRMAVPTGLIVEIPNGYEAQVRARSGLAIKNGLCLANGIGTIDSDYRGEVKILMINLGTESYTIHRGDRIAQMVICPVEKPTLEITTALSETSRASGGFGSTGLKALN